jgi:hypothetical protein
LTFYTLLITKLADIGEEFIRVAGTRDLTVNENVCPVSLHDLQNAAGVCNDES